MGFMQRRFVLRKDYGSKPMSKRMKPEERVVAIAKARKLRDQGLSYDKIAAELNLGSGNTIRLWLDPEARNRENEQHKRYHKEHLAEHNEKSRVYHAAHRDKANACSKEYYENHKVAHRENTKRWREENPERSGEIQARYREKHREEINERSKQWSAGHREECTVSVMRWREANKERYQEYESQYHAANKEKDNARTRRWQADNKERNRENHWRYYAEHKDEYLAQARMRKAKIDEYDKIQQEEYDDIFNAQKGLCAYCGTLMLGEGDSHHPDYCTMDHIVPLSRDGKHEIGNILFACRSCNSSKHAKTIAEWRPELASKFGQRAFGIQETDEVIPRDRELCLQLSK